MYRALAFSIGQSPQVHWLIGDPRDIWPRESDFHRWLMGKPEPLASCLGISGLRYTRREAIIGYQAIIDDTLGRTRPAGGLRMDLLASDDRGRTIIIETQFGEGDHAHFGQLVTYAHAAEADIAVWIVAGQEPVFYHEQLTALDELNQVFAGRRTFAAVTLTLESERRPDPPSEDEPLLPRLHRISLADGSTVS